uniref:Isochorismatase-like domain-containing protein n=1 Tax=Nelumbo nucifera TaxID=4432 RepID=A0A822ZE45_NELNU|nr:TPA_asm: hypothetical protein HUJ06_014191 [Nelumbo nucifera]
MGECHRQTTTCWGSGGTTIQSSTVEAELMHELGWKGGTKVVEKNTYSAYQGMRLEEYLVDRGIKEVIITGVMTNLCCETAAKEAFVRGFMVLFSTEATTTLTKELSEGNR